MKLAIELRIAGSGGISGEVTDDLGNVAKFEDVRLVDVMNVVCVCVSDRCEPELVES